MTEIRARLGRAKQLLTPVGVVQAREARPWVERYGGRSPLRVWRALESSRLRIVPRSVDLLAGPVVDVGANVGEWTEAVLTIVPAAEVIAVEPFPDVAEQLRARLRGRAGVVEAAVSDQAGVAELHVAGHSHNNSLRAPRAEMNAEYHGGWDQVGAVEVETVTLDGLLAGRSASLVKIDVQGAERDVLAGGRDALGRAQAVLVEMTTRSHYEHDALLPELHQILDESGYRLAGLSEPRIGTSGEALWFDACYINRRSMRLRCR